jgi:MarR family transcriptional regulator, organic hydroperoxide resistance regulator
MEEAGLITREPDPADGRLVRLHLAPGGLAARQPVRQARAAIERDVTSTLTAAELDTLRAALATIITRLGER